ncbi:hypothetical protein AEAC466_06280 [Asticcacaulis sp. AC466]|nr:hypothetical protein AEAC466_06280 [Asticcacaulis sp. AC466]
MNGQVVAGQVGIGEDMVMGFLKDERGGTAIEYGLLAAFMFLGCITAFYAFGDSATAMFNRIGAAITEVTNRP